MTGRGGCASLVSTRASHDGQHLAVDRAKFRIHQSVRQTRPIWQTPEAALNAGSLGVDITCSHHQNDLYPGTDVVEQKPNCASAVKRMFGKVHLGLKTSRSDPGYTGVQATHALASCYPGDQSRSDSREP
ncbi:hypothetical protein RRG08_024804 [Elysia crispata]|uniref:Uncharacterized protein n=1 Tax=Elysia crispata TaxID=231223 RepID=A0AAE0YIX4_9GAST|nr:hypothetical protein RRG08_024804 [Elysia crispata]